MKNTGAEKLEENTSHLMVMGDVLKELKQVREEEVGELSREAINTYLDVGNEVKAKLEQILSLNRE